MSLKLKIGGLRRDSEQSAAPATPAAATPSSAGPKLKLNFSQPPTPATEQPAPATQQRKKIPTQKKRAANDDISPAAKRPAAQAGRKPSLMIKLPTAQQPKPSQPVKRLAITTQNVKRPVPPRPLGVGYDSEDSETEEDPAIQQGFILRMLPGVEASRLRDAINNQKIGFKEREGGMDLSIKFVTTDHRRAVVKVAGKQFAAVLVDLPCIIESMKSWDKKGWWKVADIHQMLLVLKEIRSEDEAKHASLPKEVDEKTLQYAHGLTPPMHYVRKRRFRPRETHRQLEDVEGEVQRLLDADEEFQTNNANAQIHLQEMTQAEYDRMNSGMDMDQDNYDIDMDADGEVMDTTEGYSQSGYDDYGEGMDDDNLEAGLEAAFAADALLEAPLASDVISDSPMPLPDQAASLAAVENNLASDSAAGTPAATPGGDAQDTQNEEASSDEDEDDDDEEDEDDADVFDEDAEARAAEQQQHLEEVADLEKEIAAIRQSANTSTNMILRKRQLEKAAKLEQDLAMKRSAFGLGEDGD
ncbi:hypothetical protein EJ03DRAFT_387242 [Teratosphaeria nubilosa]|uniref:TAFII55 protein conserved region domain-containing protein n=1 Tax=Teratosphaeria nubilosa TaxID=161662 RepID=A0A6G1LKQ2_9PEZI|nr:hypothetical protein EJ03DRAFT_387242 [Teratosphaeria nubilosa]